MEIEFVYVKVGKFYAIRVFEDLWWGCWRVESDIPGKCDWVCEKREEAMRVLVRILQDINQN